MADERKGEGVSMTPLFTVDNPGISASELAGRRRKQMAAQLRAEGRKQARPTRRAQGKSEQMIIDL